MACPVKRGVGRAQWMHMGNQLPPRNRPRPVPSSQIIRQIRLHLLTKRGRTEGQREAGNVRVLLLPSSVRKDPEQRKSICPLADVRCSPFPFRSGGTVSAGGTADHSVTPSRNSKHPGPCPAYTPMPPPPHPLCHRSCALLLLTA